MEQEKTLEDLGISFVGMHERNFDRQHRVTVPSEFRDQLSQFENDGLSFYIIPVERGEKVLIRFYPKAVVERLSSKFRSAIAPHAFVGTIDNLGRIVVPRSLSGYVKWKMCFFVGRGFYFELASEAPEILSANKLDRISAITNETSGRTKTAISHSRGGTKK